MTRALRPDFSRLGFPETSACPDGAELAERWESLLRKAPRLRPWLGRMLGQQRVLLQARLEGEPPLAIERTLWQDLARWLRDFEALPQFAVSAIATTLQDGAREPPEVSASMDGTRRAEPDATARSPERAVSEMETLLSDPVFALAYHCVEVRLRPRLADAVEAAPWLSRVPDAAWFGLLHLSVPARPLLTADVAVSLVLRVLSADWAGVPSESRRAALRLFSAHPSDLRIESQLERFCRSLPAAWGLVPESLPEFVAVSAQARVALGDACRLCNRIAASVTTVQRRPLRGGFALLDLSGAPAAAPEEVAELTQTARKYAGMSGFRRLLELLG